MIGGAQSDVIQPKNANQKDADTVGQISKE
jgi:hypothetical protein